MTSTKAEPDTRNLQWRQNNVGSTLLQKMGWKHGEALGSKHRSGGGSHSGEGIKVVKRQEGLGLGADAVVVNQESTSHASFSQLLETLKQEHGSATSKSNPKKRKSVDGSSKSGASKKKKKKSSKKPKETVFATNKITNARVRQSKFAAKTPEDMACIFGKEYSSGQIADETLQKRLKKQRRKEKKDADKAEKKRKEREKV